MAAQYDHMFKLIVVGDSGVGKSSLVNRYATKAFSDYFVSTIGVDFKIITVNVDGKKVKLQIWDTAGQERFRTITSSFYRGARGIIYVYDVTSLKSFDNLKRWIADVAIYGGNDLQQILIGNKCDLADQKQIKYDDAVEFSRIYKLNAFFESSAKDNRNVDDAFLDVTRNLIRFDCKPNLPVAEGQVLVTHGLSPGSLLQNFLHRMMGRVQRFAFKS